MTLLLCGSRTLMAEWRSLRRVEAQELRQELCAGVQRPQGSGLGHRQWEHVEEAASGCFRENSGKCLGFGAQQTRVQILTLPLTGL